METTNLTAQLQDFEIESLRLKRINRNQNWLAKELNVNQSIISNALNGKEPSTLNRIKIRINRFERTGR